MHSSTRLAVALGLGLSLAAGAALASPPAPACSATPYQQFDFWAGDWDVFDVASPATRVAQVLVTSVLDGCALREEYHGSNGLQGTSLSSFVPARHAWQQTWLTNRGQLLVLEGGLRGDEVVLEGRDTAPDGRARRVRGIWKPVAGGVRETALTSTDDGATWVPWFDLMFRPARR